MLQPLLRRGVLTGCVAFLTNLFILSAFSFADSPTPKLKIALVQIDDLLEAPNEGLLAGFSQRIISLAEIDAEYIMAPGQRDIHLFNANIVDATFPDIGSEAASNVLYTDEVVFVDRYIFTLTGAKPFTDVSQLAGKRLGLVNSWAYGDNIESSTDIKITRVVSLTLAVKMMNRERLDAVIATVPIVTSITKTLNVPMLSYSPKHPVQTLGMTYRLHSSEQGQILKKKLDKAIRVFRDTTELSDYGIY
jgi:hypothetical protein